MKRKNNLMIGILFLIIAIIGMFCGCGSNQLNDYKSVQSEKLQCYVDHRGQENFDYQNWVIICDLLISGKDKIIRAQNRSEIDSVVAQTKSEIDKIHSAKEIESENDGAYFITDESWETLVRTTAEAIGADENWIENVLNGGDPGEEWRHSIAPKNYYYCVIIGNKIMVAEFRNHVYRISRNDNIYRGEMADMSLDFWFEEEELCLRKGNETLKYYKDDSYRLTEASRMLTAPKEIRIDSGGNGINFVSLQLNYDDGYGTHGIGIDIKKANENTYRTIKIEVVWMNQFVVQLCRRTEYSE